MRNNETRSRSGKPATTMKQETQNFLNFVDQEFKPGTIEFEHWKEYLARLPEIYNSDISFRLLFDWHWQLQNNLGRAWFQHTSSSTEDPIYRKQIQLIAEIGRSLYKLDYQFRELILLHARTGLKGKSFLEIGGSLPNDLLFDHLGIESYINIESPCYIEAESGTDYSAKHGNHDKRKTIFCDAEEIADKVPNNSIDSYFCCMLRHLHLPLQ